MGRGCCSFGNRRLTSWIHRSGLRRSLAVGCLCARPCPRKYVAAFFNDLLGREQSLLGTFICGRGVLQVGWRCGVRLTRSAILDNLLLTRSHPSGRILHWTFFGLGGEARNFFGGRVSARWLLFHRLLVRHRIQMGRRRFLWYCRRRRHDTVVQKWVRRFLRGIRFFHRTVLGRRRRR